MTVIPIFNLDFYQSEIEFTFPKESRAKKHYINCDFSDIVYNISLEIRGEFRNCVFVNGEFKNLKIAGKFKNCNFVGSVFDEVHFSDAEFNKCDFSGTIFRKPTGLYTCKFKESCSFEFSQGLSINKPVSDSGNLIMSRAYNNGVPSYIKPEKTEKVEINNPDPYDAYEVDDPYPWGRTKHGRQSIGFNPNRGKDSCRSRSYVAEKKDTSAILICSREGLI